MSFVMGQTDYFGFGFDFIENLSKIFFIRKRLSPPQRLPMRDLCVCLGGRAGSDDPAFPARCRFSLSLGLQEAFTVKAVRKRPLLKWVLGYA